jgi:hypothetical protein
VAQVAAAVVAAGLVEVGNSRDKNRHKDKTYPISGWIGFIFLY